jgi:hypothetical protein
MTRGVAVLVAIPVLSILSCMGLNAAPSGEVTAVEPADPCLSFMVGPQNPLESIVENKRVKGFSTDPVKAQALFYALSIACRSDLIDLSQTLKYQRLKELLRIGREEYESAKVISEELIRRFEAEVGVTKVDVINSRGKVVGWQLVINKKAKEDMRIRTAASLASHGYLLIESFHQLRKMPNFQIEQQILLTAIEQTATAILDSPDENGDGRFGWGRVWFKGKDGLLLHTTLPAQNIYFGGYTYFPRADSSGQMTCERSLPLKEETFDHAHNTVFLLEAFLVTRDRSLAKRILQTVEKSFDDTFDEGGIHKQLGEQGWYYWKSLGKQRQAKPEECEVGREIKNTNLRMGLALLAFSEILKRNREEVERDSEPSFHWEKYASRAMQVIRTNNYEIFINNNYGYQGANSRDVELLQEPDRRLLVYDRTQVTASFSTEEIGDLMDVIAAGNHVLKKESPVNVTICSGGTNAPVIDRGVAGSCWNHLGFEAEDYFRIARFTGAWGQDHVLIPEYLDALARNLAAAKILHKGQASSYSHYFPNTIEKSVSNEVVNAVFYGFFCLAKNIVNHQSVVSELPVAHQNLLGNLSEVCAGMPLESAEKGVTWRKGYKFYELYLGAERLNIPSEDWIFANKK